MVERFTSKDASESSQESPEKIHTGPIVGCVGDAQSFVDEELPIDWHNSTHGTPTPVDYYGSVESWEALKQKHAGENSYVISQLDASDKFSGEYYDCVGLFAVGFSEGKNISILTHQDGSIEEPGGILSNEKATAKYENDLRDTLEELKRRSTQGTVDAVIFGGYGGYSFGGFKDRVKVIGRVCMDVLGVDPVIIAPPKTGGGDTSVFCDTQRRRIYIMQPQQDTPKKKELWNREAAFRASEIDTKKDI